MPSAVQQIPNDGRMHSAIYHKRDSRVNDIIRRCKKSEIIRLLDIDAMMLFRVERAHVQFDMMQNHRPYLLFYGKAEGVFLPAQTGLLFPNACDQLDFRTDYPVDASITYALSDIEIATLAGNGLFNDDWSCQGRIIGSQLEIPCKTDYYAIANTPITFVEIQDRLSLHTSTKRTGYKALVAAFLPYTAQKHNIEDHPNIIEPAEYDRAGSEIRKRATYDSVAIGFNHGSTGRTMADGASFVEVAQNRIQERLSEQMAKSNVLETNAAETSQQIVETVDMIKAQTDKTKKQTYFEAENNAGKIQAATLDARLSDMANRMVYAGAQEIPVKTDPIDVKPLVEGKAPGHNDEVMTSPLTETKGADDLSITKSEDAVAEIEQRTEKIHDNIVGQAEAVANDIVKKTMSRRDKLAARRQQNAMIQQKQLEAAKKEQAEGMTERKADAKTIIEDPKTGKKQEKILEQAKSMKGDILTDDVDIDELINSLGL